MIHKEFWGILFLIFVGWIFVPGHPTTRIDHACRPIGWGGNIITSVSSLAMPAQQQTIQKWFDKFEYGCQYTVWRLIYQDQYNQEQADKKAKELAASKAKKSDKVQKDEGDAPVEEKPAEQQSPSQTPQPPVRKDGSL